MRKNFEIRMSGFQTVVTDVEGAVEIMKELWKKHPSNTIYVNDMWVGCVRNDDGKWHIEMRDAEMNLVAGYVMGKIKRGFDKAIADVLEKGFNNMFNNNNNNNNNMEENNMSNEMVNNVDLFNVYVKDVLVNEYNNACDSTIDACFDSENEYECGGFNYDYDIRKMWVDYCTNVIDVYDMDRDDLYNYYDENSDMFISVDDLDEVVDGFENTDDVGNGECLIWVKNPCYIAEINDTPCLDDSVINK